MTDTTSSASDARCYARIRCRLLLADLAVGALFLILFQWSGASMQLARWCEGARNPQTLVILAYLTVFSVLYYLVLLPLHFYSGFTLEHRFRLSRLTLAGWCRRELKQVAVSALIGALLVEGFYALLRMSPSQWPLWATVGWVGVSVVLARIFPTVLLPIFYKTTPISDAALVQRLLTLCERVKLPALGVFRFDLGVETRKANAALAGLGKTRRVLLSDTLLAEFTPDEIEGVLAHELAHHDYRHIITLLAMSAVGSWAGFLLTQLIGPGWVELLGVRGLADLAGFPALALWLSFLGLLTLPIQNGLSRHFERQADRFALEVAKRPSAFADALRRLSTLNLADPQPPEWVVWFFYDHPPITERIRAAEVSAAAGGAGIPPAAVTVSQHPEHMEQ